MRVKKIDDLLDGRRAHLPEEEEEELDEARK